MKVWEQGTLATSEQDFIKLIKEHGIYVDRVKTIKGFYHESLTDELQKHFVEHENKIALATIDCDLYESAVPVFEFIEPLLQKGTVIYIDDFFAGYKGSPLEGVSRAFLEFQRNSRWKFIHHLNIGWWGRSYIAYLGEEDTAL